MKNTQITLTCAHCGNSFKVRAYRTNTAKYCSKKCWENRNPPERKVCPTCDASFETYQRDQIYCSRSCSGQSRTGTNANAYKDGQSLNRDRARKSTQLREWRESVYERDQHICQHCGSTDKLHAHHIKEWANYPDLRFDIDNGLTLCEKCHGKIHDKDFSNRRNKTCPDCGELTKGRGENGLCRSCAITRWHHQRASD